MDDEQCLPDLYYPDSTVTSPHVREVVAQIERFCLRQGYTEGAEYISLLSRQDLEDINIATSAISLYLQHGNYRGADEICQGIEVDNLLQAPHALLREDLAVLALLFAEVKAARHVKVNEALALAEEVDQIYMSRTWDMEKDFSSDEERSRVEIILRQRRLWQSFDSGTNDDALAPVTDKRVEIEDVISHIIRRACLAGILAWDVLYKRLRERFPPLVMYLRKRKRRLLEANIMFNFISWLPSSMQVSTLWKTYLELLRNSDLSLLKAIAHSQLVVYTAPINKEAARNYFDLAASVFDQEGSDSRSTDLMFIRWRHFLRPGDPELGNAESISNTQEVSQSNSQSDPESGTVGRIQNTEHTEAIARQRLKELSLIHREFFIQHRSFEQLETAKEAIALAVRNPTLWPDVKRLLEPIVTQLLRFENMWSVRTLQCLYFMDAAEYLDHADEARVFFEDVLARVDPESTPDFYVTACKGAWRSYNTLEDHPKALEFALKDFESSYCMLYEYRKSEAAYRIATSRRLIAAAQIERISATPRGSPSVTAELEDIAAFLETWIDQDRRAGRLAAVREKNTQLASTLLDLFSSSQKREHDLRLQNHVTLSYEQIEPSHQGLAALQLAPLILMFHQRRFEDAIQFCDQLYERIMKYPNVSLLHATSAATAAVAALQASVMIQPPISSEMRKSILRRQYDYAMSDLKALRLAQHEGFLMRAPLLLFTIIDCIKFWPERRLEYVATMSVYFEEAQEMCRCIRRSVLSDTGDQQWLRRRTLGAKFSFAHVCQVAGEFFLKAKCYSIAWAWIQRGRAQALQDSLNVRDTATKRILIAMNNTKEVRDSLLEEHRLVKCVLDARSVQFFEARQRLERHRRQMRESPILQEILDGPENPGTMELNEIDDIWKLKDYLPADQGIVLVDWFIDSMHVIWRLDVSYSSRHLGPRWTYGYITLKEVGAWKRSYLQFPPGEVCPLENRKKALHELKKLLTGLEISCKPNDLIVLSTPGELSGIPIHGIPFDGDPGTAMIERNPVIYSAGLNLFRRCLKRAKTSRSTKAAPVLEDSYFASAYEERGYEKERSAVFSHLTNIADGFRSNKLLGDDLTLSAIRNALSTASWIHYHGHAFYAKTEALNQCLVLGRLNEGEREVQSRTEKISLGDTRQRFEAEMPYEAPLTDQEALLSGHLLEGSSRLTVADVFAMDLSSTHPVVVNIACDSGVQEFSSGDDPLGLVSALFCAGASSVLGTLWPIRSSSGRCFSEAFYGSLAKQDRTLNPLMKSPQRVLNLAFAYRDATLIVKKQNQDPYSWAPFVLQGAPMYFYNREDVLATELSGLLLEDRQR